MNMNEILLEIRRLGSTIRVSAHHVATGHEIIFQAPAQMAMADIQRLAAQKIAYALKQRKNEGS